MSVSSPEVKEIIGKESIESPLSAGALSVVYHELSMPHSGTVDGRFQIADEVIAPVDVYTPSKPIPGFSPDELATGLEERYLPVVEEMKQGSQRAFLEEIGEGLEDNKKMAVNMNHPSLLRAGMGFRGLCKALEDIGVRNFDTATVIGVMLTQLKVRLQQGENGVYIPAPDAAGLIGDHRITTVPNTENVKGSGLIKYEDEVTEHRGLAKGVVSELTNRDKGLLVLIISSGTHDKLIVPTDPDEEPRLIIRKTGAGTTYMIMDNGLHVVQMGVREIEGHEFDAKILEAPELLTGQDHMDRKMAHTARAIGSTVSDVSVEYEGLVLP